MLNDATKRSLHKNAVQNGSAHESPTIMVDESFATRAIPSAVVHPERSFKDVRIIEG